MANDTAILREYLVALGFKVDETGHKQMKSAIGSLDVKAAVLAKRLVGVGTAVLAMTTLFAKSMERLYYSSRYAETTAGNLQAIEFGARQIGLEGGKAGQALKNMTQAIRSNPGLVGLLNSLGVKVEGRDKSDVLMDLVDALDKMPPYIAERYASLFGIDPETLFLLRQGKEEMKAAIELRKQMAAEMGVDPEEAAKTGKEYMNMWRQVVERATIFTQVLGIAAMGPMKDLIGVTNQLLIDWSAIVKEINSAGITSFWKKLKDGVLGEASGDRVELTPEQKARLGEPDLPYKAPEGNVGLGKYLEKFYRWRAKRGKQQPVDQAAVDAVTAPDRVQIARERGEQPEAAATGGDESTGQVKQEAAGRAKTDPQVLFAKLEKQYALPPGLLDKLWAKESSRGKNRISPKGAEGHFGFMPDTQDEYGLVDPYDLEESADAAARKWADLQKRYKGDQRKAAAAYNWGDGNLAKYGLGKAPAETRDYMDSIAGPAQAAPTVNQETNIHIHGVSDAAAAGDAVADKQVAVNAEIVRNFKTKVR